jgi:DNA polymerase-3 subunit gamma/tau
MAPAADTPNNPAENAHYRVLARKYRPSDFAGLIGQDALVRTLTNAIAQGRLAHAFMLTGVRGVGKTTTARILARAFNCIGVDGKGGPTAQPCGQCEHCLAIAEDRHVDVIEMDAASRTGVGDIRELIEGVRYRPVSARYKIYIIDEVHMLSNNAFNALLKTLEEPPEHVKFIFATTEIRKVPVTVLSRCQRFDLRRIDADVLAQHFAGIAKAEGAKISANALALIARAADGSARDGLSLLDQAIGLAEGEVSEAQVRDMLGLADRTQLFDLFEGLMQGEAKALDQLNAMYQSGADPIVVLQDLLDLTHWLTRIKLTPAVLEQPATPEAERKRGGALAKQLTMPVLARCWQMLLKGLGEAQMAPQPLAAAEMTLIRLMHVADLPPPGDLVRRLSGENAAAPGGIGNPTAPAAPKSMAGGGNPTGTPSSSFGSTPRLQTTSQLQSQPNGAPQASALSPQPQSFDQLVALFKEKREAILHSHLMNDAHLVHFEAGRIDFRPGPNAPNNLANRIAACLNEWTGARWLVSLSGDAGAATLKEQAAALVAARKRQAADHPLVRAVMAAFPGTTIDEVRDLTAADLADTPSPEEPTGETPTAEIGGPEGVHEEEL